jgi:hypothetical protein
MIPDDGVALGCSLKPNLVGSSRLELDCHKGMRPPPPKGLPAGLHLFASGPRLPWNSLTAPPSIDAEVVPYPAVSDRDSVHQRPIAPSSQPLAKSASETLVRASVEGRTDQALGRCIEPVVEGSVFHSLLLSKPMFKCSLSPATGRLGGHTDRFLKDDKGVVSEENARGRNGNRRS